MELVEDSEKSDEITTPTDPNVRMIACFKVNNQCYILFNQMDHPVACIPSTIATTDHTSV